MTDNLNKKERSWNMKKITSFGTKPELRVRSILRNKKIYYRKNYKKLVGKPDIAITKQKKVIFVNGCFWHHHSRCKRASIPKTRRNYWIDKFSNNLKRDRLNNKILKKEGWNILTLWECEIKKNSVEQKIDRFLKAG